jgi:hypothetical protein
VLGTLGIAVAAFVVWQGVRGMDIAEQARQDADLAASGDAVQAAYTDLFALLHRAVAEGNVLAEATWYTPGLTAALAAYETPSLYQLQIGQTIGTADQQHVLSFSVLLTSEGRDLASLAVGDSATLTDDAGRTYPVVGYDRVDPLRLQPAAGQTQEAGLLFVSADAEDGTSIWTNSGKILTLQLNDIEDAPKRFQWQKGLAQDISLF